MRILIVDDSPDSRDIAEAALISGGYQEIAMAVSGWEAFKLLDIGTGENGPPPVTDIILLDIMMPEIDGIETCARIRNDARYADTPIIMVTSLDDMESLSNAFVAGASDYVTKPVNRIELIARVRSALKLKAELDRRRARERELLHFLSHWGDKHASAWIDEATGLLVGEIAEAYLTAVTERHPDRIISIVAIAIDRLDHIRASQGEAAARSIAAQVAQAIGGQAASIGVVAGAYRNGLVAVIAPAFDAASAASLGETLRGCIARLAIRTGEAIAADHVTATVAVMTGRVQNRIDRVQLLTRAVNSAQEAAAAGGNRVISIAA
jgi:sigma-B regulation protein RsbU (phosphoserine phosphatase)